MKTAANWLRRRQSSIYLGLGGVFLLAAVFAAFHSVSLKWPALVDWTVGDAATACAGFATVAVIFFGLQQFSSQRMVERSKFALDMAMEGVRQADQVLENDSPTRNIAWVNAARLILRAVETSKAVCAADHRLAWDLFREEWRIRFFGRLLAHPEYFCGIGAWRGQPEKIEIDDDFAERVAKAALKEVSFKSPNIGASYFGETLVNENAIRIIYEFTEYGEDWRDPIQNRSGFGENLSDAMYQRNLFGLWGYIELKRKYRLSMGGASRRKLVGGNEDVGTGGGE